MTIPKFQSDRDKWGRCRHCRTTLITCKGLTRDRGRRCCSPCDHRPKEEETNATD